MRRIFIAAALLLISVVSGIFFSKDIGERSKKHLNRINLIDSFLSKKDYKNAKITAKKTADEFNYIDSKIMYNYYIHKDLSDIAENLYSMHGYIERKKLNEYYYISGITKNRLQSIIEREKIDLRNIL